MAVEFRGGTLEGIQNRLQGKEYIQVESYTKLIKGCGDIAPLPPDPGPGVFRRPDKGFFQGGNQFRSGPAEL
jgi:hypothetical protein